MGMELKGRTAIVTGAGRGIGRALALEFARQGANVACCARSRIEICRTVALIKRGEGRAIPITTDITQEKEVVKMVEQVLEEFGQIDVLFNNAGSFRAVGGLWEVDPELWWHDITVNLRGAMLCCQSVLPHMIERNQGIIINMDGGGSADPFPGGSGYACSKVALMRLTDTLAQELQRINSSVLVFGMGPGLVQTRMSEHIAQSPEGRRWLPSVKEMFDEKQDGPPEECAKATAHLIHIACPELNGRIFGVATDFLEVVNQASEIKAKDLLVIRFRPGVEQSSSP